MKINELDIRKGYDVKTFRFADHVSLISSEGDNSAGKTTLIRLLLYSLGEKVPMTQGFKSTGLETRAIVTRDDDSTLIIVRSGDTVIMDDGTSVERFTSPFQEIEIKQKIFGSISEELSHNLLGAYYIDQDKGWTLLNRGKVIGGIKFSIEGFIRGLTGNNYRKQLGRLKQISKDIEKYKFFVEAAGYKDSIVDNPDVQELSPNKSRDYDRLLQLRIQSASIKKRIGTIRRAQKDNKRFVDYIDNMGLKVRTNSGEVVEISKDNLVHYEDSVRYMDGEVLALNADLAKIKDRIDELEIVVEDDDKLFNVDQVDTSIFDQQIAGMNLDLPAYTRVLKSLKKEKGSLEREMRELAISNNPQYKLLTDIVYEYCKDLGVDRYFRGDNAGILTSSLQQKSGSNYHLLVFAFRLAYATIVYDQCRIRLPIIIDSIRGRELSEENLRKCLALLQKKFGEHQIIIASIESAGISADVNIVLEKSVMENAVQIIEKDKWDIQ